MMHTKKQNRDGNEELSKGRDLNFKKAHLVRVRGHSGGEESGSIGRRGRRREGVGGDDSAKTACRGWAEEAEGRPRGLEGEAGGRDEAGKHGGRARVREGLRIFKLSLGWGETPKWVGGVPPLYLDEIYAQWYL